MTPESRYVQRRHQSALTGDAGASTHPALKDGLPALSYEIAGFVLITIAYVAALSIPYLMSDDYAMIAAKLRGESIVSLHAEYGRPVTGLVLDFAFERSRRGSSAAHLRLLGLGVFAAMVLLLARMLPAALPGSRRAALATAIAFTTPFQVYSGWATCLPYGPAFVCAWSAFFVNIRLAGIRASIRVPLASTLLMLACVTYQPATGGFFVALAASCLFADVTELRTLRANLAPLTATYLLAMAGGYAVLRAFTAPDRTARTRLVELDSVPEKIGWLAQEVVARAATPFSPRPVPAIAVVIGLSFVWAAVSAWRTEHDRRPLLGVALLSAGLTMVPNAIVAESWFSYRSIPGPAAMVIVMMGFVISSAEGRVAGALSRSSWLALPIVGAVCASHVVTQYIAVPQYDEMRWIEAQLSALPPRIQEVCVVAPDSNHAAEQLSDEFGRPTLGTEWGRNSAPLVLGAAQGKRLVVRSGNCAPGDARIYGSESAPFRGRDAL